MYKVNVSEAEIEYIRDSQVYLSVIFTYGFGDLLQFALQILSKPNLKNFKINSKNFQINFSRDMNLFENFYYGNC
jgi:hypothetical protein